jgi:hypothetical protein
MRNVIITAVAATALLAGGMAGSEAGTMSLARQAALAANAGGASPLHLAANVCGSNGCVKVQVSPPRKRHGRPATMATPHTF